MNRPETQMDMHSCNSETSNSNSAIDLVPQEKTNKTFDDILRDITSTKTKSTTRSITLSNSRKDPNGSTISIIN